MLDPRVRIPNSRAGSRPATLSGEGGTLGLVVAPRMWEPLYDAVALSMWTYGRLAFHVTLLGADRFRMGRGNMLIASHRAETDVPLICGSLYFPSWAWRERRYRLSFTPRDDLFEKGFFAGFPDGLPPRVRRCLYPIRVGGILSEVHCYPIPYPGVNAIRLGTALEAVPHGTPLTVLPASVQERLAMRAAKTGLDEPHTASGVLRGEFADLLLEPYGDEDLSHEVFAPAWSERRSRARDQIRAIVEQIRAGRPFLFFPEGRPSPNGEIGPLRRGLGTLIRRGRPEFVRPFGVTYDPLTGGRTRVCLVLGQPLSLPDKGLEQAVLQSLRRVTPLTCGQVVAHAVIERARAAENVVGASDIDRALSEAVKAAREEGRPLDPVLIPKQARRKRLSDCLTTLVRLGVAGASDGRSLAFRRDQVLATPTLLRLAREYESARETC